MKRRPQKPRIEKPTREALVEIEKPIYGGAFLARIEGKATFVPLTLPGEQARVRIVEEKRGYAVAEPNEIVAQAAERVMPHCRHFGACGGCQYQHANYEAQLAFKQAILRETLERSGVRAPETIDVLAGNPWQYRNRIRVAVDAAGGRVGYRARRSHDLVAIAECPISAPLLVKAALSAAEILREAKTAFRPSEIALFVNDDDTEVLASIFTRNPSRDGFDQFLDAWMRRIPELRGAELIEDENAARSSRVIGQTGQGSLLYRVRGMEYRVDQGAFFQVNRWLIDALVDRVVADRRGRLAWDLFAGVGLFAKRLMGSFEKVVAVESAPMATEALKHNLKGGAAEPVIGETAGFLLAQGKAARPDLVVVDPPRAGLGAETTSLLVGIGAPSIVYVSCDPATLARDLRTLIEAGYTLGSVTLADLFPQTYHLESVVELHRS
jgi:23S rRNA (uracil1939-C5)-methyltransferase